jgi:hypothetical protein
MSEAGGSSGRAVDRGKAMEVVEKGMGRDVKDMRREGAENLRAPSPTGQKNLGCQTGGGRKFKAANPEFQSEGEQIGKGPDLKGPDPKGTRRNRDQRCVRK